MSRPPLSIYILFHPKSATSRELALGLYRQFMTAGSGAGLRIPIRFAEVRQDDLPPEALKLDDAEHTLVVPLVDARMAQRARAVDRPVADAWAVLLTQLVTNLIDQPSPHGLLPVAVGAGAFGLATQLEDRSFVRLDRFDNEPDKKLPDLCFQVAAAALQLLRNQPLPVEPTTKAPIQLFISHAKVDMRSGPAAAPKGAVVELLDYLAQGPVDAWYDAKKIAGGKRFDEALGQGVIRCDVMVCVITDRWSEREWCRREAIMAKRMAVPLVMVDALDSGSSRLFPYVGNARMVRWRPGEPQTIVLAALLEALRRTYSVAVLTSRKQIGDFVLGVPPEALTLRRVPPGTRRVVYPDPPLPREELEEISPVFIKADGNAMAVGTGAVGPQGVFFQAVELTTPLTELTRWQRPPQLDLIGLSLSGATDIDAWGASSEHLTSLADDLVTMLLITGLRLGYGGMLDYGGSMNDEVNYTTRLFGLVRSYSPMAKDMRVSRFHPILNFVPWPVHLGYGQKEHDLYGREAELEVGPSPSLGSAIGELSRDANGFFPRETLTQKWAYACGRTAMRKYMAQAISARVAIAGKLEGYSGLLPGVLEEILIARCEKPKMPLYLIGAFGGATRYAIDLIEGHSREESTTAWVKQHVPTYAALAEEYGRRGDQVTTPEQTAEKLRALGQDGPAKALDNGLTDPENRELFTTTDSYHIVELILKGLRARFPS
jgi:hypothetical protein